MNREEFKELAKQCPWHNKMTTNLCQAKKTWADCNIKNCAPFFWAAKIMVRHIEDKK